MTNWLYFQISIKPLSFAYFNVLYCIEEVPGLVLRVLRERLTQQTHDVLRKLWGAPEIPQNASESESEYEEFLQSLSGAMS